MPRLTRVSPPNVAGETRTAPGGASGQYPSGVGRQAGLARAGNDEGEFAIRRERSAAALYPMGLPVQPNHDAATRVGADAPDSEVILYRDSGSHQRSRDIATSDLVGRPRSCRRTRNCLGLLRSSAVTHGVHGNARRHLAGDHEPP